MKAAVLFRTLPFVFLSGIAALTYELAWMKELKLVFGFSTAASATVLAVFSAGLGLGAHFFGRRVDASPTPLRLAGFIEAAIGLSGLATILLLPLVRTIYVALGGTVSLGVTGGTLARLLLSTLVLITPTFLMGGTLPAFAKALEGDHDSARWIPALVYGVNALGAVLGCLLPTFLLFDALGIHFSIGLAAACNLIVAISCGILRPAPKDAPTAAQVSLPKSPLPSENMTMSAIHSGQIPQKYLTPFVATASFATGFVFFAMELVWYRMLAPILGGSVYTFGLILAVALVGIGTGGAIYSFLGRSLKKSASTFALTCLLEALFFMIPFALGDHLAIAAALLRDLGYAGFVGQLTGWGIVTGICVLPGALVAGFQFPFLLALLGEGSENLGKHVGFAYVANTLGSVCGSLVGGFALLPYLSAPELWKAMALTLAGLGFAATLLGIFANSGDKQRLPSLLGSLILIAATGLLSTLPGPSAVWRHSSIGAGRAKLPPTRGSNDLKDWMNGVRRAFIDEFEGIEASIGVNGADGLSFFVNGKSDGHVITDAGTQIGSALLPSLLHPELKKSLVIGLGTGSTAGWLATMPAMERVDVVEIEPKIVDFARLCSSINKDALNNPKLFVHLFDAREFLLVGKQLYDTIVSEPSNPYRVGIASLYTREFFSAVADRLAPNGLFVQFLQGYEVDASALVILVSTLAQVLPEIEIWHGAAGDILLVAAKTPLHHDLAKIKERIGQEPWKSGLAWAWTTDSLAGVMSHRFAGSEFTKRLTRSEAAWVNTDDINALEFGFAGSVGKPFLHRWLTELGPLANSALGSAANLSEEAKLSLDQMNELRFQGALMAKTEGFVPPPTTPEARLRAGAIAGFLAGESPATILGGWQRQKQPPTTLPEKLAISYALASAAGVIDERILQELAPYWPADVTFFRAFQAYHKQDFARARELLKTGFGELTTHPFSLLATTNRAVILAKEMATGAPELAAELLNLTQKPFAAHANNTERLKLRLLLLGNTDTEVHRNRICAEVFAEYEPHPPWEEAFLKHRAACYTEQGSPRAQTAQRDLNEFISQQGTTLSAFLKTP